MIKRIFFLSFLSLAVFSAVSCRTNEEIQEEIHLDSKVSNNMILSENARFSDSTMLMMKGDSAIMITPMDPPKSGTHFKVNDDSLIIINH